MLIVYLLRLFFQEATTRPYYRFMRQVWSQTPGSNSMKCLVAASLAEARMHNTVTQAVWDWEL